MYDRNHMMGGGMPQMAPEDSFAEGFRRAFKLMASFGRNGDSELAHITPDERRLLEARGGAGTINPVTGFREEFGGEGGGGSMGRDDGRVGGGSDRDDGRSGGRVSSSRDIVSGPSGGRGGISDPSLGRSAAERATAGQGGRNVGGVGTNPSSAGGTAGPTGDTMNGGASGGEDTRSGWDRFTDGVQAALAGPSFGPPTGDNPGFLGAAASLAPGIGWGMALTNALHGMGFESTADFGNPDADQRDDRMLSPNRQRPQAPRAPQASSYAWTRPGSLPNAPMALRIDPAMTPLQQRAHLATGGTAGNAGIFRDPAEVDYYRQIATHALTDPSGAPLAGQSPLPVELQFVEQMGGQPGNTLESFLTALAGLQA